MSKQVKIRHYLAILIALAQCGPGIPVGVSADRNETPRQLPAKIVKVWGDAGARVGWMNDVPPEPAAGYNFWKPFREQAKSGAIPAFRFHPKNEDVLTRLPDPGVPFGLDFHCSAVKGPWLKNMAGLKSLRSLKVSGSLVLTDTGLQEVARLKNLQGLHLFHAQVTDAGLKELAGLKNMRALGLSHTQVKGVGLKALASLKSLQALNLSYAKVTDAA